MISTKTTVTRGSTDGAWTVHVDEAWIAWLTFDRPGEKVNTFTEATLLELEERLDELAANEAIKAVAIRSGKTDAFIAGADIGELATMNDAEDARAKARAGLAVFEKIESLPVPSIAVIHGACLGGGLEMALACTYRLVTDDPKTTLGLPEVNLGIIPGWGGTQRLPRVIGLGAALGLILAGKPVAGRKAHRMGLADGIVAPAFLEPQTRAFLDRVQSARGRRSALARRRRARPRLLRALERTAPGRWLMCAKAWRDVTRKTKGLYPAPLEALGVLRRTAGPRLHPRGFNIETEAFSRLACTSISRNLVWLFQTSQRLKRAGADAPDRPATRAAVVGAGIMGGGIAWALSRAGLAVRLKDISWPAVAQGMAAAARIFDGLAKRRKMAEHEVSLAMHRISGTVDYSGFAGADVVVEAVVEDLAIKKAVLREIEAAVGPDTIICTNTSSLPLADLAGALRDPKRFVGLHFFNPVNRMQLVEVVACRKTSRRTLAAAVDVVRRMGKLPVVVGDCPGFLVNRILLPYLIESAWMFEEGVEAERIDAALERFGMPMGPIALVDEVGIDTGYKVAKVLESAYGPRMHVADVLGQVVERAGLQGRKSGRGFYIYDKSTRNGHRKPNPDVTDLVDAARRRDGVSAARLSDDEIVDRAVLIMVNEAARCLEEGIAPDPETIDMAMVMGTGFAPFRGGLLRYADERGVDAIKRRLDELAVTCGDRFRPVPLVERLAKRGAAFHGSSDT
jgi:3-hydroxyacyl-CoA dehydrogenase/enoyl-CoA hydratase/3-hydroxybutyryl-CoA epimerase